MERKEEVGWERRFTCGLRESERREDRATREKNAEKRERRDGRADIESFCNTKLYSTTIKSQELHVTTRFSSKF